MVLKWCTSKRDNPEKLGKHTQSQTCSWSQCFIIARSSESFHDRQWFEHPRHLLVLEPLTRHKGRHNHLPIDFSARHAALCWPALWRSGFHFQAWLVTLVWPKPNREPMDYFEEEDMRDQNQHWWRAEGCCWSNMECKQCKTLPSHLISGGMSAKGDPSATCYFLTYQIIKENVK